MLNGRVPVPGTEREREVYRNEYYTEEIPPVILRCTEEGASAS